MTTRDAYAAEEWKAISGAPMKAALLVMLSDVGGPVGTFQESGAMLKAIVETGSQSSSGLVAAIAQQVKEQRKPEMPDLPEDRDEARRTLLEGCTAAADIVAEKAPDDADAYRSWLVEIARRTANAAKEGTFLGFGGTRISEAESTALADLEAALSVDASEAP
jgi:hypothetical protein